MNNAGPRKGRRRRDQPETDHQPVSTLLADSDSPVPTDPDTPAATP